MPAEALSHLQAAAEALRASMRHATPLEALVILPILQDTCALVSRLDALIQATRGDPVSF